MTADFFWPFETVLILGFMLFDCCSANAMDAVRASFLFILRSSMFASGTKAVYKLFLGLQLDVVVLLHLTLADVSEQRCSV